MLGLLLVLVLCAAGAVQAASQELLENVSVVRQVSLEAQIVRELLSVNFTNVGTSPASFYLLPVEHQGHLAHLQVSPKKDMTSQIPFTLVVEGGSQYAKISVGPVAPGKSSQFFAHLAYTHVLEPHPKEIPQTEKQQMLYRGNVYLSSPYPTLKIKTSFSIPTSEGTSTDKALTLTGNKFSFGPATDRLEPFSRREATIHYKNNNPFLVTEKLVRTVEVSHWGGNVAFEESYSTIHAGAKLKGFYSRLDYDHSLHRHAETPVIKKIDLSLPIGAADVYYRDAIGNVSTSHFFGNAFESTLELMPRYPLFGGWKTEWSHGYNLPLSNALQKTPQGSYALNILFVAPYSDAVIDDFTLLVILPEGATNIRFVSENDLGADVQIEHIQTYLDTFGRPTVKATKKNVINEHRVPIQIQYDFPAVMMLQEPMLLNGFFFVLFFTAMVVSRIDLSIEKH